MAGARGSWAELRVPTPLPRLGAPSHMGQWETYLCPLQRAGTRQISVEGREEGTDSDLLHADLSNSDCKWSWVRGKRQSGHRGRAQGEGNRLP